MPRNSRVPAWNERRLTHAYPGITRILMAVLCLVVGVLWTISSAQGQPRSPAAPTTTAASSAALGVNSAKPRSAVEVHKERVDKFRTLANALYARCTDSDVEPEKSAAKTAVARKVSEELTTIRTVLESVKKEVEKTKKDLDNLAYSDAENTELKALEDEKAKLAQGATFPPEEEKRLTELRIKKSKFQELTLKLGAQRATLAAKSTQLAEWTKKAEGAAADVEKAFERFTSKGDVDKGIKPGICLELCGSKATVLDVCTFREAVPATAAVLADWASVDALSEYIGKPRANVFDKYGVDLTDLPADVFFRPAHKKGARRRRRQG
ncbi:MAG: hypothetical protein IPK82_08815 [Polyangiaceae bacterium]|nr:hypothetical protein [Polyangiaceae bacterium]